MKCHTDGETLQMTTREGIEIDHCPKCSGVWLDRGELDKIIERTADEMRGGDRRRQEDVKRFSGKGRKKESPLGELFDF
jgi:Zn-finger nucleic acid-binding protein